MKKILKWENISSIKLVVQSVKNNKLIVGSTDTVLGLFASVNQNGKELLDLVKKREKKPYIILLSEKIMKEEILEKIKKETVLFSIIKKFWPGPLTIIVDTKDFFSTTIIDQETIAIRVPKHQGIGYLLEEVGMVFSTSANLAGHPIPKNLDEVNPEILKYVEYGIVDQINKELPSTIIRYDKNNKKCPIILIREGIIKKELLKEAIEELFYL